MKKSWKIFFLISMLLSGIVCVSAIADDVATSAQAGVEISSVTTAGNTTITNTRILAKVRSRVGDFFDPAIVAEDVKRIAELKGVDYSYYNAATIDGKIQLTFVVVEKNLIRSITFTGNRKYKKTALRKKVDLKTGDYIDTMLAEQGKKALLEFYQKKGFAFAQISFDSEKLLLGKLAYNIEEGSRVKIESVNFSGNNNLKTKSLKKVIKTKKRKFFFWRGYYNEKKLTEDLIKLQKVYQKKGFLDSDIKLKSEFNKQKNSVRLTFVISEGEVYKIEKVSFTGNKHFDDSKIQAELKLDQGQVYSEKRVDLDVKRLNKLYREIGFVDAKAEKTRTFVSRNRVNVDFVITEGQRFRIGQVNITGNAETHDRVIRQVLNEYDFRPGKWYNADYARGDGKGYLEKLVRRSTYTESAIITPTGQNPDQKNAQVNIIEGQTGSVMLGAGIASDSGVIGQLVFEQRNFDIKDKPESLGEFITGKAFKGAGQHLRIAMSPGTEVSEYSISFTEPYFKNKPVSLDVVASSYERWRESYDEKRTKGYFGFQKRYKNRWRRSIGFRVENVDVGDLDTDAPQEIIDDKGENLIVGVRLGVGRDFTDDKFNPSSGYTFNAGYEQVAGDHTFGILNATHRKYKTLHEDLAERKTILATKLHAATILGDAPSFEKFYAGGQGSIRGFDYRGVSTRGLQTDVASPKRKDPIGSDWIFLANAEVTIPLVSENLSILFFVDSGAIDSGNYRASIGTGIQILIPRWFGPVPMRFEIAAPLMKDGDDETQAFSFSVGKLF